MNKKIKIGIISILLLMSFGCTKYVREDGKNVVYEKTGQTIASNILCKPVDEELYNFYKEHEDSLEIKLDDLPVCSEFTPSSIPYKGIWESILVKPIAWLILKLGELVGNCGISVMLMSLCIRALMLPLSIKSVNQSENMKKVQPEMAKIEKKYANKTDKESMMQKSQEMMMLYQKYKIHPLSGCLTAFIQLPLFFAFLEAINRVPAIFEGSLFGLSLGMTPTVGLKQGNYLYIVLLIIIMLSTIISFKNTMASQGTKETKDQMKTMTYFMTFMIFIASLSLPTAIALYWIVNNIFAIAQTIIIKKLNERRK